MVYLCYKLFVERFFADTVLPLVFRMEVAMRLSPKLKTVERLFTFYSWWKPLSLPF